MRLICAFVFAYAKSKFSCDAAHIIFGIFIEINFDINILARYKQTIIVPNHERVYIENAFRAKIK